MDALLLSSLLSLLLAQSAEMADADNNDDK
jgi:hypothetical protein